MVVVVAVPKSKKRPALVPSLSCPVLARPVTRHLSSNGRRVLLSPQAIKSGSGSIARDEGDDISCFMPASAPLLTTTASRLLMPRGCGPYLPTYWVFNLDVCNSRVLRSCQLLNHLSPAGKPCTNASPRHAIGSLS